MVNSRLNSKINYIETKKIEENDQGLDADLWSLEINGKDIDIIIGNLNFSHKDKDVIYINIYIIKDENVDAKIGVYEISTSELPLIEENINDDTLDLDMLGDPLFFSFVNNDFLEDYVVNSSVETSPVKEEFEKPEEEFEEPEEEFEEPEEEFEKPEEEFEKPEEEFEEKKEVLQDLSQDTEDKQNWVNKFFNKTDYDIIDNEGGGDCLFAVIRDAFVGIDTPSPITVKKMRQALSKKVTKDIFENYYKLYKDGTKEQKSIDNSIKQIKKEYDDLTKKFKNSEDVEEKQTYSMLLDELKERMYVKQNQKDVNKEYLNEYRFMKGIENLDQLKEKIKTCDFWAETWAVTTLEKILNIKLILLSSENYEFENKENVLLCGQVNDEEQEIFNPKYYILVDYNGYHYQLITYKNERFFNFETLPLQIKKLIITKCLEKQSGIYSFIPEFNLLKEDYERLKKEKTTKEEKQEEEGLEVVNKQGEKQKSLLYDEGEGTVFQFYSHSGDKLPGKGIGESIKQDNILKYSKLNKIKNWRRKLSNFDIPETPFKLDDLTWNSVEHYYQGSKFKKNNPEFYNLFSVESDSEISKNPKIAKYAGEKNGKFQGKEYRNKSIKMDEDFFTSGRFDKELERAMYAKFSQDTESKNVLLETKDAKLQQFSKGKPANVLFNLMNVRRELKER